MDHRPSSPEPRIEPAPEWLIIEGAPLGPRMSFLLIDAADAGVERVVIRVPGSRPPVVQHLRLADGAAWFSAGVPAQPSLPLWATVAWLDGEANVHTATLELPPRP